MGSPPFRITSQILRARLIEQLSAPASADSAANDYSTIELLAIPSDEAFILEAYLRILGRRPELDGMLHFSQVLKREPRQVVINALTAAKSGPPASSGPTGPHAPRDFVDLTSLDKLDAPEEFVAEGYRRVLNREPDRAGLSHYRMLLLMGVAKVKILGILAASEEGRGRGARFLWQGTELPKARLGVAERLQLLFWKITGSAQLQNEVAGLRGELSAVQARTALLLADAPLLPRKLEAVGAQVDALRMQMQALAHRIAAAEDATCERIATVGARMTDGLQAANRSHRTLASAIVNVRESISQQVAQTAGKLDAVLEDIRALEQALQAPQLQRHTELAAGIAGLFSRTDTLAQLIRPPVLTGTDVFITKVNDFILAIPQSDIALASMLAYWGSVDQGLSRYLSALLKPGMVFVDIGANIGMHTLEAARAVGPTGRVYSFEPAPFTVATLRRNVELNELTGVEIFPLAVLDRSGETKLYLSRRGSPLNSLFPEDATDQAVTVRTVTLDEALEGRGRVDAIKIDAEGSEPLILRGMKKTLAANPEAVVIMEFAASHLHRAGAQPAGLLEEIRASGFEIGRIDDTTGEIMPVGDEEILASKSVNLSFQRQGASSGA